jgi:hypothetical protein
MIEFYKQSRSLRSGLAFCMRMNTGTEWFQYASVRRITYICSYLFIAFFSATPLYTRGNAMTGDPLSIQAQGNGEITCSMPAVTIWVTVISGNQNVVVEWTGPAGFTSNLLENSVSTPGMYYVKVMTETDTVSDSVEVVSNVPPSPSLKISKSGDFCTTDEVVLTCETDRDNSYIIWRAPRQVAFVDVKSVTVKDPGVYTVIVTDSATDCYAVDSITVYNTKPSPVILPEDTPLTCGKPCIILNLPNTENTSYSVMGSTDFYSNDDTVKICESGRYTIRGVEKYSGCFIEQSLTLTDLAMHVEARKTRDLSCKITATLIYGVSNDPDVTFQWAGPDGFTSSDMINRITTPGTYVLTVTNQNNNACHATDTIVVFNDISQPSLNVTKLNDLTCNTPSATLTALSETASVTFSWSGPNGFVAGNTSVVEIAAAGDYLATVTKASNGCSRTDTISVSSTIVTLPSQMQYYLTCDHPCLKLALPEVKGVQYQIRGVSGFTSNQNPVTLCDPGFYELTATAPASGCVTSHWFEVMEDFGLKLSVDKRNDIDCREPSSVLTAFSPISGVEYSWQGPEGFQAVGDSVMVTVPGVYIVSARDTVSNCYAEQSVEVLNNIYYPEIEIIKTKDLYCENDEAMLIVSSSSEEVNIEWDGPLNFHSTDVRTKVHNTGIYSLQVTHLSSGCKVNKDIEVNFDSTAFTTTAYDPLPITCERLSTQLMMTQSSVSVDYRWTGPEGFQSEEYYPVTSIPGLYSVILTERLSKICQIRDTVIVKAFNSPIQLSILDGVIYCAPGTLTANVDINAEQFLEYNDYTWTGPDGATFNGPYMVSEVPGIYSLEIHSRLTGCTASATTELVKFDCPETKESASASKQSDPAMSVQPVVTAYPNPSRGAVALSFITTAETHYKLEVYSFDGMVYNLFDEDVREGEAREIIFNSENNRHGMFVYKLLTNDGVVVGRFVIE